MGIRPLIPLLSLIPVGCADMEYSRSGEDAYAQSEADTGWYGSENEDSAPSTDADEDLGSESENDFLRLLPATTDKYVFVANPARNTVTRVSPVLDVITVDVGVDPGRSATRTAAL